MMRASKWTSRRLDDIKPAGREGPWAVVLGEGEAGRPGSRARLREAVDRIGRLIPPARTLVVGLPSAARDPADRVGEAPGPHVLDQPDDRGTGAAVLLAALWIEARAPRATMVFLPLDHVIEAEVGGMARVAEMADFVERRPEWMILLGTPPREPDMDHDWIEPGQRVGWTGPSPVYGVRRVHERPAKDVAEALVAGGCLRNTSVWAARPGVVLAAGREGVPRLYEQMIRLPTFWAGEHEQWALHHAYALAPAVDFSRAILGTCSMPLAVLKAP
jgi:mannose-1-phosphate guanylyltransferase